MQDKKNNDLSGKLFVQMNPDSVKYFIFPEPFIRR